MRKGVYFDHTAVVELLSGNGNILRIIDETPDFYTGAHVAAELMGAEEYLIEKKFSKERKIRALLRNFKVLPVDRCVALKAAELIGSMKAGNEEVLLEDALTAAQVLLNGLVLVTKNRELARRLKKHGVESKLI